jgi:glycosyltransferase involved in cell wall biosynthesis
MIYLALGDRRLRAAEAYSAAGTLVRDKSEAAALLRTADEVFAGDPEALALAYAHRRPGLVVRLEPAPDPGRRTSPADLAVVTPWYPSPDDPFAGAFVRAATAAVRPGFARVSILHTQSWFYGPGRLTGQLLGVAAERQARLAGNAVVLDTAEGELTRVAVPSPAGGDHLAYADEQTRALRAALPTGRIEAPVVHAHVGILGGVVAARLARPDARLVVTEHATFLAAVLARPAARERYARMLDRADLLLCVGRDLRDQIAGYFPEHAGKLRIVPNAIDFDRFAVRPSPPAAPSRWLYVGRLMEHKGVLTLIDAFTQVATADMTLTLVGSGPLEDAVDRRVGDRITRRPPVSPDQVTALLHEHDVLVHASRRETFGMTVVEAVATGTPVLVARSEGPAETLAGLADRAGVLVEPSADPAVLVAGFRRLQALFGTLDLPGARAELQNRYGNAAVAAQLHRAYESSGTISAATVPGGTVPVLQRLTARLSSPLPEAVVRTARRVVSRGAPDKARWKHGLPDRARPAGAG